MWLHILYLRVLQRHPGTKCSPAYQTTNIHSGDDQFITQWNFTHLPTGGLIFMSFSCFSLSQAITLQINQRLSPPPISTSQRHFASQAGCSATAAEGVRTLFCCRSCNTNQAGWLGGFIWDLVWKLKWVDLDASVCIPHTYTICINTHVCLCVCLHHAFIQSFSESCLLSYSNLKPSFLHCIYNRSAFCVFTALYSWCSLPPTALEICWVLLFFFLPGPFFQPSQSSLFH